MKRQFLLLIVTLIHTFLVTVSFSQNNLQSANEKFITVTELGSKADKTDFNGRTSAEIYKDDRNTYYAIDKNSLGSRYLELRILEQVYSDKSIVHIGQAEQSKFILFLVNNIFNEEDGNLLDQLNKFYTVALKEKSSMKEEQISDWINKHDKSAEVK